MANEPGWYPDPWQPGRRRWWDGRGWSDHTWSPEDAGAPWPAPPQAQPWPPAPVWPAVDPRTLAGQELAAERRQAGLAKVAFIALAASQVFTALVGATTFADYFDDVRDSIDNGTSTHFGAFQALTQISSLVSIAALILVMVWTYRAATVARNLRYPATRSVGWATAGWMVPVVNFWFPYQGVRDMLPPGHAERPTVGRWWALYLVSTFSSFAVAILSFVSIGVAVAAGLVVALVAALAASHACHLVDAVSADHADAVARIAG